jgi:hypothetical protein
MSMLQYAREHLFFILAISIMSFTLGMMLERQLLGVHEDHLKTSQKCELSLRELKTSLLDSNLRYMDYMNLAFSKTRLEKYYIESTLDSYDTFNSEHTRKFLADRIQYYASKYSVEWELITALLYSESNFNIEAIHKHPQVLGMAGIHSTVWIDVLTKQGIINSKQDLTNADTAIETMAFILSSFQKELGIYTPLDLIHKYKGLGYDRTLGKSGRELALKTLKIYEAIKDGYRPATKVD